MFRTRAGGISVRQEACAEAIRRRRDGPGLFRQGKATAHGLRRRPAMLSRSAGDRPHDVRRMARPRNDRSRERSCDRESHAHCAPESLPGTNAGGVASRNIVRVLPGRQIRVASSLDRSRDLGCRSPGTYGRRPLSGRLRAARNHAASLTTRHLHDGGPCTTRPADGPMCCPFWVLSESGPTDTSASERT